MNGNRSYNTRTRRRADFPGKKERGVDTQKREFVEALPRLQGGCPRLARRELRSPGRRMGWSDGSFGLRQIFAALRDWRPGASITGQSVGRWERPYRIERCSAHQTSAPQNRLRLSTLQSASHADSQRQYRHRTVYSWGRFRSSSLRRCNADARPGGTSSSQTFGTFRRGATARRHCARDHQRTKNSSRRRTHRKPQFEKLRNRSTDTHTPQQTTSPTHHDNHPQPGSNHLFRPRRTHARWSYRRRGARRLTWQALVKSLPARFSGPTIPARPNTITPSS